MDTCPQSLAQSQGNTRTTLLSLKKTIDYSSSDQLTKGQKGFQYLNLPCR